jgi:hypothetical protein
MVAPWIIAALAAAWFAFMAHRAGRSVTIWALGGGFFGLTVTTIVWGVGQAEAIPFSDQDGTTFQIRWTVEAFAIVAVCSGALMLYLKRQEPGGGKVQSKV